jgi:hypothetical protein
VRLKDLKTIDDALDCYIRIRRKDVNDFRSEDTRKSFAVKTKEYEATHARVRTAIEKHETKLRSKTP